MGNKKELTKREKRELIERMKNYDKDNREYSTTGQILNLIAVNGLATIKSIYLIKDYTDSTLKTRMYKLIQLGLIKKSDNMCQLKNIKNTYDDIKYYVPNIPVEIIEERQGKARGTHHKVARERLGKSSEVVSHIFNMEIPIAYSIFDNNLTKKYIISSYIKKELNNQDISRSRAMGVLINKDIAYIFYYINSKPLTVINKEAEYSLKKNIDAKIKTDVIVINNPRSTVNLFVKERNKELMLDKMGREVLMYPNIKTAYEIMELTMLVQFRDEIEKRFKRNHETSLEADVIEEDKDRYTLYWFYPDIQRLRRFYLMMYHEIHNYKIVTFEEYREVIEGIEEMLDIKIEKELYSVEDIEEKLLNE